VASDASGDSLVSAAIGDLDVAQRATGAVQKSKSG
jgi:hypothetical protein